MPWFEQFAATCRHRLLVAEGNGVVVGYAGTTRFRNKAAYERSVETTVYCSHDAVGHGIGSRLYAALFEAIAGEDIHRIICGYTLPNAATLALHERFGFKQVAVFSEAGRKFGRFWDVGFWSVRCDCQPSAIPRTSCADKWIRAFARPVSARSLDCTVLRHHSFPEKKLGNEKSF